MPTAPLISDYTSYLIEFIVEFCSVREIPRDGTNTTLMGRKTYVLVPIAT